MAESTTAAPPRFALARRLLFLVLLGPLTVGMAGKVQGGGGPSVAGVVSNALGGGPAGPDLAYLTVAALAVLGALAIFQGRR
jgi:hypothetical protein